MANKNTKASSRTLASEAARTLADPSASKAQKRLAGSVLAQANTKKQTGSDVEDFAAMVLQSSKYGKETKSLAGSALSQSNKSR